MAKEVLKVIRYSLCFDGKINDFLMNWVWNVRERIIPKLGSSIPSRIEFPLINTEKAERTERWVGVEQKFSFKHTICDLF